MTQKSKQSQALSDLLDQEYGPKGSAQRIEYEQRAKIYEIGKIIRTLRKKNNLTQEQLAEKIGTKKSYISKIEHGADMQLSTMIRIFEQGLDTSIRFIFGGIDA